MKHSKLIAVMLTSCVFLAVDANVTAQTVTLRPEIVSLKLEDGDSARAFYYSAMDRSPHLGFVIMHPRGDGLHFLLEPLAREGFATLGV
ncbi:MAG: hypothetical protein ACRD1T_02855, partial [Acidimicrobiia bacterium]